MGGKIMQKLTHEIMMELTEKMPMKQISLDVPNGYGNIMSVPYLQRYYAGTFDDGSDLWFHHFLSNDGDRNLHSHPFEFKTVMLVGGYSEEYIKENGEKDFRITLPNINRTYSSEFVWWHAAAARLGQSQGSIQGRDIGVFDWHRISAVEQDTWTMMIVKPKRLPAWFFKDDEGNLQYMKASRRDWWVDCKTRDEALGFMSRHAMA